MRCVRKNKLVFVLLLAVVTMLLPQVLLAQEVIFSEDFEGLTLGPNVDETLAGDAVWTNVPPEGWSIDNNGMPGFGNPDTDGVTEWAGWSFPDKLWWINAAGDQNRSEFTNGTGIVAVADPDEWDDLAHAPGWYNSFLSTPPISLEGYQRNSVVLTFDSSWRPEWDSNYHQSADIKVSYDGGPAQEVMLWVSDSGSPNYKPYATNETVELPLNNPDGATSMVITFGMFDAGNDWWWAVDNISVSAFPKGEINISESDDSTIVFEKGQTTDTITVSLSKQPTADVTVTADPNVISDDVSLSGGAAGGNGKVILTFTSANWDTPQTITVQAINDTDKEGPETGGIVFTVQSDDPTYADEQIMPVLVTIIDDDQAGVIITQTDEQTRVREGSATADTFTVTLASQPTDPVTITITDTADPNTLDGGATVGQVLINGSDAATLTFAPDKWDVPQTVSITAVDDSELELDPHETTLNFAVASSDLAYEGLAVENLTAKIEENECGAWGISPFDVTGPEGVSDCQVDLLDFAAFASNWLICTRPYDEGCVDLR